MTVCKEYLGWCPNTPAIRTAPAILIVPPENIHSVQPGNGRPAGSSGRIRSGISIAAGSIRAVLRDRQLLWFTLLSGLVMLFLILAEEWNVSHIHYILSSVFSIPIGGTWISFDTRFFWIGVNFGEANFYVDLPLFLIEIICLFCFTILLAGLVRYWAEKDAHMPVTIPGIFGAVRTHATTLAALSFTMALSGAILDAILFQTQFFGKIVFAIEMAVFNLPYAYYLQGEPIYMALLYSFKIMFINILLFLVALYVVPVIVLEKKGMVPAIAGSVSLMKQTWRELLGCAIVYGVIVLGVAAVALVIGQSPYLLNHDFDFFINMSRGQMLTMTVCFLFLAGCWAMMAAGFTAAGIAITDLYSCGTEINAAGKPETGCTIATEPAS